MTNKKPKARKKADFSTTLGPDRIKRLKRISKMLETTMTATVRMLIDEADEKLKTK